MRCALDTPHALPPPVTSWVSMGTGVCGDGTGSHPAHTNYGDLGSDEACKEKADTIPEARAYEWRSAHQYGPNCRVYTADITQANGEANHACYKKVDSGTFYLTTGLDTAEDAW